MRRLLWTRTCKRSMRRGAEQTVSDACMGWAVGAASHLCSINTSSLAAAAASTWGPACWQAKKLPAQARGVELRRINVTQYMGMEQALSGQ